MLMPVPELETFQEQTHEQSNSLQEALKATLQIKNWEASASLDWLHTIPHNVYLRRGRNASKG